MKTRFLALLALLLSLQACDAQTAQVMVDQLPPPAKSAQGRQWNGTIIVVENGIANWDESTAAATSASNVAQKLSAMIVVKDGKAQAEIDYLVKIVTTFGSDDEISSDTGTAETRSFGKGTSTAKFNLQFHDDGTYAISYSAFGIKGLGEESSTRKISCKVKDPMTCNDGTQTTSKSDPVEGLGTFSGDVSGKVNGNPNELVGGDTYPFEIRPGVHRTGTVRWQLKRSN